MNADRRGERAAVGFVAFEKEGWQGLARHEGAVARALVRPEEGAPLEAAGRGTTYRFATGNADEEGLVRICRRGGLAARALGSAYILGNRPLRELRIHVYACYCGLPVPAPLGAAWRRLGPLLFGRIATRLIPGAVSWHQWLRAGNTPRAREVGKIIRAFHDRGINHADLNMHNVLLDESRAYIIDLDKASVHFPLSRARRASNLLRLKRSMEKEGHDPEVFDVLCRGYGRLILPAWTELVYRTRTWRRRLQGKKSP